ncbi:ABC transporter ATP-binding protein [soil metagenome]
MNNDPIVIDNVSRAYDGPPAVKGLSFSVKAGSIYGFLGRNGSGKTTTLRMLAGLIKPQSGQVRVLGKDPFTMGAADRQFVGYMAENAAIAPYSKVRAVLQLGRDLYPTWDDELAMSLASRYDLSPHKRFMALSQGNQRLLGFIMAIAPRPKVLLLDEPAANLDVVARREILDDILDLIRDCGCTVLFSSHILSDVERVADEVGILAKGCLRTSESLDSLKDTIRQVRFFGFPHGVPADEIPDSFQTKRGKDDLLVTFRTSAGNTPESLAQRWSCQQETRPLGLEDIFVEISRN